MKYTLLFLLFNLALVSFGQSKIERLYQSKKYDEIIAIEKSGKNLSGPDLYRVGLSYLRQKQDSAAIEMFTKAEKKGHKNGDLYYKKAIAYSNSELYNNAAESCKLALMYTPTRKPYLLELAAALYQMQELDSSYRTYKHVQKLYPDNQLSAFMVCQILHEQEKLRKCLDCYYGTTYKFKDHNQFYRESYEHIYRLERYTYKQYDQAEKALKVLMKVYSSDIEYQVWALQFYNFRKRYDESDAIVRGLQIRYDNGSLPQKFYQKGSLMVDEIDDSLYTVEVFYNFQPKKHDGVLHKAFLFTKEMHRPFDKVSVKKDEGGIMIEQKNNGLSQLFEKEYTYKNVIESVIYFLHNPPIENPSDSLDSK